MASTNVIPYSPAVAKGVTNKIRDPWGAEPALTTLAARGSLSTTPDFNALKGVWWKVFVYGTLKKNFHNHHLLKDMPYLGKARTIPGAFGMYSAGSFPVLGPTDAVKEKAAVSGELYAVDAFCIVQLDRLEGNGSMYNREKHWVSALDQQTDGRPGTYTDCLMYVGRKDYWDFKSMSKVLATEDKGKACIEW